MTPMYDNANKPSKQQRWAYCNKFIYEKSTRKGAFSLCPKGHLTGNALSSQFVSRQVLSAYECLTTVFGMGTGGTTQLSSPDIYLNVMHIQNYTEEIYNALLRTF